MSSGKRTAATSACKRDERRAIALGRSVRNRGSPTKIHANSPVPPFSGPIIRDLLYHVWPTRGKGIWQRNLDQLIARIDLFEGRRIVGIVTDPKSDPPDAVMDYLAGYDCEFVVRPNHSRLGEVVTFPEMLAAVETDDPNRVIFYGHAKGVRHSSENTAVTTVHRWADAMYETCLDDWDSVQTALNKKVFAGSFRRNSSRGYLWHYSGTFFWFRASSVFQRRWKSIMKRYGGVEFWPGRISKPHESACLFLDDCGNLYDPTYWRDIVDPAMTAWRLRAPVASTEASGL